MEENLTAAQFHNIKVKSVRLLRSCQICSFLILIQISAKRSHLQCVQEENRFEIVIYNKRNEVYTIRKVMKPLFCLQKTMFNIEVLVTRRILREAFCASSAASRLVLHRDISCFFSSLVTKKKKLKFLKHTLDELNMNPVLSVNPPMSCQFLASANGIFFSLRVTNYTAYISTCQVGHKTISCQNMRAWW